MSQDTYNLVSTILGGLTFAAAFGTLLYLRKYTQATRDQVSALEATARAAAATARVASEQVEATSKPCLLISTSEPQADRGAETASTVLPRRGIMLLNVGNGPAIDVQVKFERSRQGGEPTPLGEALLAYLRVGMHSATPFEPAQLEGDPGILTASYASMSGKRYETSQMLLPSLREGDVSVQLVYFRSTDSA